MKKWLIGVGAAAMLLVAGAAQAAQMPLQSGAACSEPSQMLSCLNQTITTVNARVNGTVQTLPATAVTTLTTIQTLMSATLPAGFLLNNFDGIHLHAWGVNSADANVKTVTVKWGAGTSLAVIVTGSGNQWTVDCDIYKTAASVQVGECHGVTNVTPVTSVVMTAGAETDTAVIPVLVQGTAATAGTVTLQGAVITGLH